MPKLYKMLFLGSLTLGTVVASSSYTWLGMWMGLEINLLSMIPLMSTTKNPLSTEASIKYFLTQALASFILLFSVVTSLLTKEYVSYPSETWSNMILTSALLTKLGAAPFHFWFPEVMEGLSWFNCLIMLTWQKIAPMTLIMNNPTNLAFMTSIIVMSISMGSLLGLNQVSMRKILAFSSINHIGWLLAATMSSSQTWVWYMAIYSLLNLNIVMMLSNAKSSFLKQLINSINKNKLTKLSFMINFMSLGGLPPFLGFLPKWLVINSLLMKNHMTMALLMVVTTLISLYVYLRIMFSSLTLNNSETKTPTDEKHKLMPSSIILTSSLAIIVCTILLT